VELLVSMAITMIIVTVLVSVTSIAMDTWNRSRSELRSARQAKAMVDSMARDFEGLVTRSGNNFEWLSALPDAPGDSSNASKLVFFTAATDRYDGEIGGASDKGGDVSCVGYRLYYKNPIDKDDTENQTFVLNRHLVNPDKTFANLLGATSKTVTLDSVFEQYKDDLESAQNFVCENVNEFTITFQIEVSKDVGSAPNVIIRKFVVPISMRTEGDVDSFRVLGTGIEAVLPSTTVIDGVNISDVEIKAGRLTAVGISLTILSDAGIKQLPQKKDAADFAAWLAKNSYQYSKLIQLPGM